MQGINLRELIERDVSGYRCLVEAVVTHKFCPEDPLTDTILNGAQGVGYAFWPINGEWWKLAISVQWEFGNSCNYIETYRRRDKIRKPITEIKFIRDFGKEELLPLREDRVLRAEYKTISDYFKII